MKKETKPHGKPSPVKNLPVKKTAAIKGGGRSQERANKSDPSYP
jgi:hypothetical protein